MIGDADIQTGDGGQRFRNQNLLERAGRLEVSRVALFLSAGAGKAADQKGEQGNDENELNEDLKWDRKRGFENVPLINGSQDSRPPTELKHEQDQTAEYARA